MFDFTQAAFMQRLHPHKIYNEMVVKACGVKRNLKPNILDTTAGLGKDTLLLAASGCKVIACERNNDIFNNLQLALTKAP